MFEHPKIQELLAKTGPIKGIGSMIQGALAEVIKPTDRIIACYYSLEQAERKLSESGQKVFYACSVYIVTNQTFISLGFYPKFHRYSVNKVRRISEMVVEYRSPSKEELQYIPEMEYVPESVSMKVTFEDEQGNKAAEWEMDTAGKGLSNELMDVIKILTPLVGLNLEPKE